LTPFSKLWAASAVSNVGDGAMLAAGPLLLLSVTDDPTLVALGTVVQYLPWLLFSLAGGALADRADRVRLIVAVDIGRAALVGLLAAAAWLDLVTVALVYAVLFGLAAAETVADAASTALLPAVVEPGQLSAANGRLGAVQLVGNRLAGPPLGAWLFATAAAAPFAVDAASFVVAAALVARIGTPPRPIAGAEQRSLRREIGEGIRWLWAHPGLRSLAVAMGLMNVVFMLAFATWPLFVRDRLGLGSTGFGLLLTMGAIGGIGGSFSVAALERRFGAAAVIRAGLVVETLTHGCLATATSGWFAAAVMAVFGVHAAAWGAVALSIRQRLVPDGLLGRVSSAYMFLAMCGAPIGALMGGPVAARFGLRAPFVVAFGAMALIAALAWRPLRAEALTS